ncbi:DNA cytosine methyltransferase [Chryseobacterium sp. 2987]|uniref:DNA cytosine methyltransferase n=1 Tax=Chryseobacterium sp. 2987 TaxID=2817767 RepID=UPI00285563D5|nr:DNA cytosine methyltransferase [Chryseobacterium sp. 2987]MDR6919588.1 DNA (cytosine-5)-methyltransferase 1 [Chryseobacterium sp. 2987]
MKKLTHIELFAGCGGMNLGLESAGFELYFANEVSPMASETFAYNFLNENLTELSENNTSPVHTLWVCSDYAKDNLKNRLRENPFSGNKKITDLTKEANLGGKLLVGDIDKLLSFLIKNRKYKELQKLNIDLVSGGPPCQSFSLAGKREKNNSKNLLPLSFAKFAGLTKPKVVLLENVKGITAPFNEDNEQYFAWLEVSKAFSLEGFVPLCMMVNSKFFGIPQNRPRFILLAYRKDIFDKLFNNTTDTIKKEVLTLSRAFYERVNNRQLNINDIKVSDFKYYDIEEDPNLFDGQLFPKINKTVETFTSVKDAIGDLSDNNESNAYKILLEDLFDTKISQQLSNFEIRHHNSITQARFRVYQILEKISIDYKKNIINLLRGKEVIINEIDLFNAISSFLFIIPSAKNEKRIERKLKDFEDLKVLMKKLETKKHTQKALIENMPAPAQLTIPDDICHYDFNNPRVLTVREMARIQSFPDWFVFKSKTTTGGDARKFEVPQYTQVGNAVPPLLAYELGNLIKNTLNGLTQ